MLKTKSVLFFLSLFCVGRLLAAESSADRLIGTWKSNRALTLATIKVDGNTPPEVLEKMQNLFGKMIVTYTKYKVTGLFPADDKGPEWTFSSPYTVKMASQRKIIISTKKPESQEMEEEVLHFEGRDRYWVALEKAGGREYFDRVVDSPANRP